MHDLSRPEDTNVAIQWELELEEQFIARLGVARTMPSDEAWAELKPADWVREHDFGNWCDAIELIQQERIKNALAKSMAKAHPRAAQSKGRFNAKAQFTLVCVRAFLFCECARALSFVCACAVSASTCVTVCLCVRGFAWVWECVRGSLRG